MKKNALFIIFCFFALFLASFVALGWWNMKQGILKNGEPIPTDSQEHSYALTGAVFDPATGRYRFEFPMAAYDGNYRITIIQVNSSFTIFQNGRPYFQYAVRDPYKRIQQIPLTQGFYDPAQQKMIIEYSSGKETNQQKVLLGLETQFGGGTSLYNILQLLSLGALIFMLIYAISLFIWKPSERYLFLFIVYTAVQILWDSLTFLPQYTDSFYSYITETIINEFSVLVSLLSVFIILGLLNFRLPKKIARLDTKYWILAICLFVFAFTLFNHSIAFSLLQYFRLIGGSLLLIYACIQKKNGAWILLSGYAISQGMMFYSMLTDINIFTESLPFSYVRAAKLPYLPFTFAIMVFINYVFANKFKESEKLTLELKEINQSLDQMVESRTNELKRQQAFRHNMMLNVIHDLRSPLFVLKGCTDIIPAGSKEVRENLEIMKERIDFITHLTEDLFLIEQLEDDKVLFACEPVDLTQTLKTIGSACRIEANKKRITLEIKLTSKCLVWGDPYRLGQAIQNLIINGIYYTPENGQVTVTMLKDEFVVRVLVHDTGKGIDKEEQAKVFERYYHSGEKNPHSSTGLGLSIAQEIIKRHQGLIGVESTLGVGSTFEIVLPIWVKDV